MASASRPDEGRRLPRARRITRSADIRAILRRGKRSGTAHLDVFDSTSPVAHSRVGVIVPKHKHTVVERNLLKRRLRELLRTDVLPALQARGLQVDVLVRARKEAYGASYSELEAELVAWMARRCLRGSSS